MTRNFENNVVLTAQNPEAFLVFSSSSTTEIVVDISAGGTQGKLLFNGMDISKKQNITDKIFHLKLSNAIPAPFMLQTKCKDDFDFNISFYSYTDAWKIGSNDFIEKIDVSIHNRPFSFLTSYINEYPLYEPLIDDKASYTLLRTNSAYSGNIKLVIDSSNNIFLDTFKVSDTLSNKKYRKQKVSANSFLSGDIRNVFETIPLGDIYVASNSDILNIDSPKTLYDDQYDMTYSYGVRMINDELYDEDYAILAPIWINEIIPSHFAIFRLDKAFNVETYINSSLNDFAFNYVKDSNLIKSWSIKNDTPIGTYLNNHTSELLKIQSPLNLSLNIEDPNTWYGIAIDKGIITGRSEVPFFFEQKTSNLTELNAFVSQGFSRNNLLCPNLINTEYLFSDNDVSMYSMHRYFGLYLTENELYKIAYYSDTIDGSVRILMLNDKDVSNFINSPFIFDASKNIVDNFKNRIFVLNDNTQLKRITNLDCISGNRAYINEYVNKLGKNIFSTNVEKIEPGMFITFTLNNLLYQGEHLRIINKTKNIIWEIYGVDTSICTSQYVSFNTPNVGYPELYRTSFSVSGTINDQIESIKNAFDIFKDYKDVPFRVGIKIGTTLSIFIEKDFNDEYLFQRITSDTLDNPIDLSSNFSISSRSNDISFYGVYIPTNMDFSNIAMDASYGPIDFESFGNRRSLMINILNTRNYNVYSFNSSVLQKFTNYVLYPAIDNHNYLIQEFDISVGNIYSSQYIFDPTSINNNFIIITDHEIKMVGEKIWNAYDVFPLSISLMGINPVKDFDFTVYDSLTPGYNFKSSYWYKRENDASTYELVIKAGEINKALDLPTSHFNILSGSGTITLGTNSIPYIINVGQTGGKTLSSFNFNTYFNRAIITTDTDTTISYSIVDGSFNFTSYDSSLSEESINDYYLDESKKKLKYGLVIPNISKWGAIGSDCRTNPVRLNLTADMFQTNKLINTNFIPYQNFYPGESTYPVFKYLSPGVSNWKDYIYYDIYDLINHNGVRKTLKQLIFDEPNIDIFSKMVYSSFNINERCDRSSIAYYDIYKDAITCIIKGLKLSFKANDISKTILSTRNWDRFRVSFISTPSINRDNNYPIEVIINENTKTILIIWYQGNDILSYSKRYSSKLPGKNNLKDINSYGIRDFYGIPATDASYAYVKSPYLINTNSLSAFITNKYAFLDSYDSSISRRLSQLNYNNINDIHSVFTAYGNNDVSSYIFNFNNKVFNTFNQNAVEYSYVPSSTTIGNNIVNVAYSFSNNYNYYQYRTANLFDLNTIIQENNIFYYVITSSEVITNRNYTIPPVITSMVNPILYKSEDSSSSIYTFNGAYKPIFKDILNFSANEDFRLIDTIKQDFILGNTNLISHNPINQYWFNRVVENVNISDSSNNILFANTFSPFLSSWDANYYTLCNNSTPIAINGYESNTEVPSFFGSKVIKLPNQLILNNWTGTNSSIITTNNSYILSFNISESIKQLFLQNTTFVQNWSQLPEVKDSNIVGYINKTILGHYNIHISKIIANICYIPTSEIINDVNYDIILNNTNIDNRRCVKLDNLKTQLVYEQGNYIYKVTVPISDNRSYYVELIFNKK